MDIHHRDYQKFRTGSRVVPSGNRNNRAVQQVCRRGDSQLSPRALPVEQTRIQQIIVKVFIGQQLLSLVLASLTANFVA